MIPKLFLHFPLWRHNNTIVSFRGLQSLFEEIFGNKNTPGANVIKLFTAVIYHHSMLILSFCVIKLYYPGNYHGMAVNYCGILILEKVRLEVPR
jgi:hypothetical protein